MGAKANPPCPPFFKGGIASAERSEHFFGRNHLLLMTEASSSTEANQRFAPFEKGGYGGFALAVADTGKNSDRTIAR